MRLKVPFTGVHVGATCIDGSRMKDHAHAHLNLRFKGYICADSNYALMKFLRHEIAHLMSAATHETQAEELQWQRSLKSIGGRVPARRKRT